MARINTPTLKASSLLETIVAMMIVMLVFFVAMAVYANIIRNSISLSVLSSCQQLEAMAEETKKNKSYFNETLEFENRSIVKRADKYSLSPGLIYLELEVLDKSGKTISVRRELISE